MRNCSSTLAEAITSVMNQDFPHNLMEIVFVDDGSEDNTLSLIRENMQKLDVASTVIHTSWKGVGHARNIVIANARGKYIVWVDGDMILSKDFVSLLVNFMEEHTNVGIAKGKQSLEKGNNLLATLESCSRAAGRMVNYASEKARSKALGTGGAIYRTSVLRQIGGFDEGLRGYGEDWDLEIRVRDAGWSLIVVDTEFSDFERHQLTWRALWSKYWLRGYYSHYFLHKNGNLLRHSRMNPIASLITGLVQARTLFPMTRSKLVFLLPFENFFKMSAWYVGFTKSHWRSYQPTGEESRVVSMVY